MSNPHQSKSLVNTIFAIIFGIGAMALISSYIGFLNSLIFCTYALLTWAVIRSWKLVCLALILGAIAYFLINGAQVINSTYLHITGGLYV